MRQRRWLGECLVCFVIWPGCWLILACLQVAPPLLPGPALLDHVGHGPHERQKFAAEFCTMLAAGMYVVYLVCIACGELHFQAPSPSAHPRPALQTSTLCLLSHVLCSPISTPGVHLGHAQERGAPGRRHRWRCGGRRRGRRQQLHERGGQSFGQGALAYILEYLLSFRSCGVQGGRQAALQLADSWLAKVRWLAWHGMAADSMSCHSNRMAWPGPHGMAGSCKHGHGMADVSMCTAWLALYGMALHACG